MFLVEGVTWTDVATWVGLILTAVSAFIAVCQARKAKTAADHAEEIRDEITRRNSHNDLASLNGLIVAAIRAMDKYGPGAGPAARHGCSPESDTASVRALTSEILHLRSLLKEKVGGDVDQVAKTINDLLVRFAVAPDAVERDKLGCEVFVEINEFRGNIKKELDGHIYR